jgi:hypothetical protein
VFIRFIDKASCSLVVGVNKDNVIRTIERLDADRFRGAVGVVDSDYSEFLGVQLPSLNICRTDENDLECMILESEAFDKVLLHYSSSQKVAQIERMSGLSVRALMYAQGASLGAIRLAAKRAGWPVKFSSMTYSFSSNTSFEIDTASVCRHVLARSQLSPFHRRNLDG